MPGDLQRPSHGTAPGSGRCPLAGLPGQSTPCFGQQGQPGPEKAELYLISFERTPAVTAARRILDVVVKSDLLCHVENSERG